MPGRGTVPCATAAGRHRSSAAMPSSLQMANWQILICHRFLSCLGPAHGYKLANQSGGTWPPGREPKRSRHGMQGLWFDAGCVWDLSASGTGIGEADLFTDLLRQIPRDEFKRGAGTGDCCPQPSQKYAAAGAEHALAQYRHWALDSPGTRVPILRPAKSRRATSPTPDSLSHMPRSRSPSPSPPAKEWDRTGQTSCPPRHVPHGTSSMTPSVG